MQEDFESVNLTDVSDREKKMFRALTFYPRMVPEDCREAELKIAWHHYYLDYARTGMKGEKGPLGKLVHSTVWAQVLLRVLKWKDAPTPRQRNALC